MSGGGIEKSVKFYIDILKISASNFFTNLLFW